MLPLTKWLPVRLDAALPETWPPEFVARLVPHTNQQVTTRGGALPLAFWGPSTLHGHPWVRESGADADGPTKSVGQHYGGECAARIGMERAIKTKQK